jgi:predicted Zn-dependent protease
MLTGSLSLFVLTSVNNTLFSLQGSISLLQSAYGQYESEDEDEDDEEQNGKEEDEDEDENNRRTNSIEICCSWDERLADGELTYKIIREGESDEDEEEDEENEDRENAYNNIPDVTAELEKAVRDAVQEWNTKFQYLKLVEVSSSSEDNHADIEVQFVEGFPGMVAGATMIGYGDNALIDRATIILPKSAFYVEYESEVFGVQYSFQKLKEIAIHEMGHALGLGHANFDADIMSQSLSSEETLDISQCDINGVIQANSWKLVNNNNNPDSPNESSVNC